MANKHLFWQVRESALAAVIPGLHVLAVSMISIPLVGGIYWIFDHATRVDWKLSFTLGAFFASAWCAATFFSTMADLRKLDRIGASRDPSFRAGSFFAGLYGLTIIGSFVSMVGLNSEGDPPWMQLIPAAFLAMAFYAWPRTIHCGADAVSQRNLLGWKKHIPYASIEAISVDHDGTITVLGAGTTIEHTQYHVGAAQFEWEVSKRSGKSVYRSGRFA